jgi:hypothetical protein
VTEPRAKELLDRFGIKYEQEPGWITIGRKPDFYCSEPEECWCEVKTLEPSQESKQLSDALEDLRKRSAGLSGSGMGIAHVSATMSHKDAKMTVQLLKRPLKRLADQDAPDMAVALLPKEADRKQFVRFSLSTRDDKVAEFHSHVSTTGLYALPSGMYPEPDSQVIELKFSSGRTKKAPAHTVLEASDDFRVAIAIHPSEGAFEIVSAMPTGAARRLNNVARIREAVRDANEQVKNANAYKAAPSITLIFQDGLDVPEDTVIKSALYGDLTYVAPKDDPASGSLVLEGDGAWNSTKNRTTSAVMYVRNGGEPMIVHNYWAERPLPAGLFSCKEVTVTENGTFNEVDFSQQKASTHSPLSDSARPAGQGN